MMVLLIVLWVVVLPSPRLLLVPVGTICHLIGQTMMTESVDRLPRYGFRSDLRLIVVGLGLR